MSCIICLEKYDVDYNESSGRTLYQFNYKEVNYRSDRMKMWKYAAGKSNDWIPSKVDRICEVHFHAACFQGNTNKLKCDATPTIDVHRKLYLHGSMFSFAHDNFSFSYA